MNISHGAWEGDTPFEMIDLQKSLYQKTPRTGTCQKIDVTRMSVEMLLNGNSTSHVEINTDPDIEKKYDIHGNGSFIFRYRRESENIDRPAFVLGFTYRDGKVFINQLQGTNDKHVAFRVDSSFDIVAASLDLIEENFLKKWIPVEMSSSLSASLDNPDVKTGAYGKYEHLSLGIRARMHAYRLDTL